MVSVSSSQRPDGDYALRCTGIGYPSAPIEWDHLGSDTPLNIDTQLGYQVTSTSDIIIPAAECRTQYTCTISLAVNGRTFSDAMSTNSCSKLLCGGSYWIYFQYLSSLENNTRPYRDLAHAPLENTVT